MTYSEPARTAARRTRPKIIAAVVVVSAVVVGVAALLAFTLPGDSEPGAIGLSSDQPTTQARTPRPTTEDPGGPTTQDRSRPGGRDRGERRAPTAQVGEADGALPEGVTVFDDEYPAVGKLDPDLLDALQQAATDAENDGVEFVVNSGWRSEAYQNQLLREAVAEYGSEEEASKWVATPDKSLHVKGEAIDLGPSDATPWMTKHGADYGLCQIYENEPWHFELRPEATDDGCPPMYADPTEDPRMQQ
jgi:zinc D-Ala-D-Ala carboxypeptidase